MGKTKSNKNEEHINGYSIAILGVHDRIFAK